MNASALPRTPIFIVNMAAAAAGQTVGSPAFGIAEIAGQGDHRALFLAVGEAIYRRTSDKIAAEMAMNCLATIAVMVVLAAGGRQSMTDDQTADLLCYFAERLKSGGIGTAADPKPGDEAPTFN